MNTQGNGEVVVLTREVVASQLEEVIADLTGFIKPVLEKTRDTLNEAVVCDVAVAKLQLLVNALTMNGGADHG